MLTLKKIILLSCLLLICSKVSFAGDSVMTVPNTSGKEYLPVPVGSVQAWPIGSKKQREKDAKGNPVWLECDGSTFDAAKYPELATALGGNKLPDYSGDFLRGYGTNGTNSQYTSGNLGEKKMAVNTSHSHSLYSAPIAGNNLDLLYGDLPVPQIWTYKSYTYTYTYDPSGIVEDDRTYTGTDMLEKKDDAVFELYSDIINSPLCTPSISNGECECVCVADGTDKNDPYTMNGPCSVPVKFVPSYVDEDGISYSQAALKVDSSDYYMTYVKTLKIIGRGTWTAPSAPIPEPAVIADLQDLHPYFSGKDVTSDIDFSKGILWTSLEIYKVAAGEADENGWNWNAWNKRENYSLANDVLTSSSTFGSFIGHSDGSININFNTGTIGLCNKGDRIYYIVGLTYRNKNGYKNTESLVTITVYKYEDGDDGGYYVLY